MQYQCGFVASSLRKPAAASQRPARPGDGQPLARTKQAATLDRHQQAAGAEAALDSGGQAEQNAGTETMRAPRSELNVLVIDAFGAPEAPRIAAVPYSTRFHFTPPSAYPALSEPGQQRARQRSSRPVGQQRLSQRGSNRSVTVTGDRHEGVASRGHRPSSFAGLVVPAQPGAAASDLSMILPRRASPQWRPAALAEHARPLLVSYVAVAGRQSASQLFWAIKLKVLLPLPHPASSRVLFPNAVPRARSTCCAARAPWAPTAAFTCLQHDLRQNYAPPCACLSYRRQPDASACR